MTVQISRRDMLIASASIAAASALGFSSSALAEQTSLTPGTYTATAQGYMGEVTVVVELSDDSIVDVKVASCTDMPHTIPDAAIATMPSRIVQTQSTACDVVTGATMTSLGILNAVRACLAQAGDEDAFDIAPEPLQKPEGEDVDVDILVIGGGAAGMTAALNAQWQNFDEEDTGLKVMLVEKLAYTGGSVMVSGGSSRTAVPLDDNSPCFDDTYMQPFIDYLQGRNTETVNEPLLRNLWSVSGGVQQRMERMGGPYVTKDAYADIESYPGSVKVNFRLTPPRAANHVYRTQVEKKWYHGGIQVQDFMQKWLSESGIDLRVNTRMLELLTQDGAVIGARVEGPESVYTVHAHKTIMATGGFSRNPEMIARYAPAYEGVIPFVNAGATGEGFQALVDMGATPVGNGIIGYLGTDMRFGMWPDMGTPYYQGGGSFVAVNSAGKRFVRDGKGFDSYMLTEGVVAQEGKVAWAIIDSQNPDYAVTDASVMTDYKWKADSIEELAQLIGVPGDTLADTIDAYNSCLDNGTEDEFGVPAESMLPVKTAPFYAVVLNPITIGTLVGVACDENCQMIVDGSIVPNLYVTGELIFGGNICTVYQGALSNAIAYYSGYIAATHAKQELMG